MIPLSFSPLSLPFSPCLLTTHPGPFRTMGSFLAESSSSQALPRQLSRAHIPMCNASWVILPDSSPDSQCHYFPNISHHFPIPNCSPPMPTICLIVQDQVMRFLCKCPSFPPSSWFCSWCLLRLASACNPYPNSNSETNSQELVCVPEAVLKTVRLAASFTLTTVIL